VATALFIEKLDATILKTAVSSIAASLQVPALSLRSVVSSYVLRRALGIRRTGGLISLRSFLGKTLSASAHVRGNLRRGVAARTQLPWSHPAQEN
jgi:hypothetical protein